MIVVAGFTSFGKTSLALNIAEHLLLTQGKPVGIFSLEMTALELVKRCICSHAQVSLKNVRHGELQDTDFPRILHSANSFRKSALYFQSI